MEEKNIYKKITNRLFPKKTIRSERMSAEYKTADELIRTVKDLLQEEGYYIKRTTEVIAIGEAGYHFNYRTILSIIEMESGKEITSGQYDILLSAYMEKKDRSSGNSYEVRSFDIDTLYKENTRVMRQFFEDTFNIMFLTQEEYKKYEDEKINNSPLTISDIEDLCSNITFVGGDISAISKRIGQSPVRISRIYNDVLKYYRMAFNDLMGGENVKDEEIIKIINSNKILKENFDKYIQLAKKGA